MKLKTIAKPFAVLALTACTSLTAFGGTAKVESKAVVPAEKPPLFTGTLEAGWDSQYYFRGLWFASQTVWTGANISVPLTEKLTLGFGALYTTTAGTNVNAATNEEALSYSELDLTASLAYQFKYAKLAIMYTNYQFLEGFSGTTNPSGPFGNGEYGVKGVNEFGVMLSAPIGPVNVYGAFYYDFTIGGSYIEAGIDYTYKINKWLSLVPSVKGGYGFDYYSNGAPENGLIGGVSGGLSHLLLSCAAPITIAKNATVTPYVAWNISGRSRRANNTQDNECFGGVKLSVTF